MLERIVAETRGNPLALLELPRGLTPAQLAGGFGLPAALPLSAGIEQSFQRRLATAPARRAAAAAPSRRPSRSATPRCCGAPRERARDPGDGRAPAESEGLLTLDGAVVFRHPLVRSAVYGAAEPNERREAHRALADATDPQIDPDRRAWHRAQAASVPDEDGGRRARALRGAGAGARRLRCCRGLPRARGRADTRPVRRAQRALVAAQTKFRAGALDDALGAALVNGGRRARRARSRPGRTAARADRIRLHARQRRARRCCSRPPAGSRRSLRRSRTRRISRLCRRRCSRDVWRRPAQARSTWRWRRRPHRGRPSSAAPELLLDGLATFFCESYEAAVPILRRAQDAFDVSDLPVSEQLRWKWLATVSSVHLWDDARWEAISERHVQIARETGALGELPLALSQRVYAHLFAGELTTAAALVDEIRAATEATGSNLAPYGAVGLAALRGREPEAISLIDESRGDVTRRGEGIGLSVLDWARGGAVQRPRPLRGGARGGASGHRVSARPRRPRQLGHGRVDRGCGPSRNTRAGRGCSLASRGDGQRRAGRTGPSGRRALGGAPGRTISGPRSSISRRSIDSVEPGWPSISLALTSSTASG